MDLETFSRTSFRPIAGCAPVVGTTSLSIRRYPRARLRECRYPPAGGCCSSWVAATIARTAKRLPMKIAEFGQDFFAPSYRKFLGVPLWNDPCADLGCRVVMNRIDPDLFQEVSRTGRPGAAAGRTEADRHRWQDIPPHPQPLPGPARAPHGCRPGPRASGWCWRRRLSTRRRMNAPPSPRCSTGST